MSSAFGLRVGPHCELTVSVANSPAFGRNIPAAPAFEGRRSPLQKSASKERRQGIGLPLEIPESR